MRLFFALTAGFLATQVIMPHLDGLFPGVLAPWVQSSLVMAEAGILFMAYRRYRRDQIKAELNLTDSFRYIGIANRQLEIISDFAEGLGPSDSPEVVRGRISLLLGQIAVAGLGAEQAVLRIVEAATGKTLTEWTWSRTGKVPKEDLKIPNRQIIQGRRLPGKEDCLFIDQTPGMTTLIVLAAILPPGIAPSPHQETFIRTLLRLIHGIALTKLALRPEDRSIPPLPLKIQKHQV